MLAISLIKNNPELVKSGLKKKHFNHINLIDEVIAQDEQRKSVQKEHDEALAKQNLLAKEIGTLMKQGDKLAADAAKMQVSSIKEIATMLAEKLTNIETTINEILIKIPNLPHESVPEGRLPDENEVVFENKLMVNLPENAKPHWELASAHQLINFELGVKITGAGFPVYLGKGAKLQRALINYFLDSANAAGYLEIEPPILINEDSGFGTGQLPDKEGQMYHVGIDNLYLVPTAEVPVTNLYRDLIFSEDQLPIKNTAYTPCFRREAGSYGKDVRGLNRLHQFDKVEIVQIVKPENSYAVLEEMRTYVAGILDNLQLPYRILRLCGGDMSFASALTYDFEVWSAAQQRWLEVSSVSNFESFQTNRMKCRYKDKESGKNLVCHSLNGSALALPRIVAALLENNQQADGSILIPPALVQYTGFETI